MSTYLTPYTRWDKTARRQPSGVSAPLQWLQHAWRVLLTVPATSAALGIGFTALCVLAYAATQAWPLFTVTIITLLLAVSPFFAAAAYTAASQVENGRKLTLASCVRRVAERSVGIGIFAAVCGLLMAAWVRLAGLAFVLSYNTLGLSKTEVTRIWASGEASAGLLIFLVIVTAVLAVSLFTITVFTLPRIVARDSDVVQAVSAGLSLIKANPLTVAAWSVVLLVVIGLALASQLFLMPLIFPMLAYASWFCYSELTRS